MDTMQCVIVNLWIEEPQCQLGSYWLPHESTAISVWVPELVARKLLNQLVGGDWINYRYECNIGHKAELSKPQEVYLHTCNLVAVCLLLRHAFSHKLWLVKITSTIMLWVIIIWLPSRHCCVLCVFILLLTAHSRAMALLCTPTSPCTIKLPL